MAANPKLHPVTPVLDRAATEVARLRNEQRAWLVETAASLTMPQVAAARGSTVGAAHSWLRRHRDAGRLVSVRHGVRTLVPAFQLDADLTPRGDVYPIVSRMVDAGMGGWGIWTWWCTVNSWLDLPPIEALDAGRADAVHEAADRLLDRQG